MLALAGLVLTGCGSSGAANAVAGAAGTDGRAAHAFPASTAAFLDANVDESSTGWKQLLAFGARFPSWPKFAGEIQKGMNDEAGGDSPTLAQLRSWLGPELAVGVLDVPAGGADPEVLAFAEVRDRAQLEAALKESKDTKALGTSGAYDLFGSRGDATIAISSDTALLSNSRAASTPRSCAWAAPATRCRPALLPGHHVEARARQHRGRLRTRLTLPKLLAAGRKSTRGLTQAQIGGLGPGLDAVRSLGFSFGAAENGLRVRGTTLLNGDASDLPAEYAPTLLERIPASSWLAAWFGDLGASDQEERRYGARLQPGREGAVQRPRPCSASRPTTSTR